jgi:hypothetical protein
VTAAPAYRPEPAVAAALLSAGAAAIHASAAGPHFAEHLLIGALFVVTALAQAAWAALALTAPSGRLLAAGAVGNVGVVAAWAMSRTVGLPFGPEAWVPEPVAALDLAATSFEIVVVAACILVLGAGGPYAAVGGVAAKRFATVGAIAIAALTSAAYAATPNGGHDHHAGEVHAAPAAHHHRAPATKQARVAPRRVARPAAAKPNPKPNPKPKRQTTTHAHAHATPHSH